MSHPTGWFEAMSLEEYLTIDAMSASGMEHFATSPLHYRWAMDNPTEPTDAMREGTALHMALLEPEEFAGRYVVLQPCMAMLKSGARKGEDCGKASHVVRGGISYCGTHDPVPGEALEVEVLSEDAHNRVVDMRHAVLTHPDARKFFSGKGRSEVVGVWRDESSGVLCKIRLDRDIERASVHADVKTCPSASAPAFMRHAGRMGYHRKAAWYRRGMEALGRPAIGSVLIAVEHHPPHGVQLFLLRDDQLDALNRVHSRNLIRYAECRERRQWPGYDDGLRDFEVLPWDMPTEKPMADEWGEVDDAA